METDVAVKRHPVGDRGFVARLSGLRIDTSAENTVALLVFQREDTGRGGTVRICRGTGDALAVPDAVAILIEVDMLRGDVDFHKGLSPLRHLGLRGARSVHRLAGHGLKALNVCNQGFGFLCLIDVPAIVGFDGLRRAVRTLPGLCTGRGIIFISEPLYIIGHLRRIDGYGQALTAIYPGCDRQTVEDLRLIVWQLVGDTHAVHGGKLLTDGHGLRRGYGALIDRIHVDGSARTRAILRLLLRCLLSCCLLSRRLILCVCRCRRFPRAARRKTRPRIRG